MSSSPELLPERVRIRRILLAGNPYNGFLLEDAGFRPGDGPGESDDAPAFDIVRKGAAALDALQRGVYDLVLADQALSDMTGSQLAAQVRERFPDVPVVVFTGNSDLGGTPNRARALDPNLFIYYGAPSFWRALVKLQEDERNAPVLLPAGAGMAILLVEDEPNFYSHFLPTLHERIRACAIELLPENRRPTSVWGVSTNRPLVILRRTFEEAVETLMRYELKLLALITDLCFPVGGDLRDDAGLRLLYRARAIHAHLPVAVTSRNQEHRNAVMVANAKFLWKDSPRLLWDLDHFLTEFCGFGPFALRWPAGEQYGLARTLAELRALVAEVPDVVFEHHALHHDFSAWLVVHGYERLACTTRDMTITDANLRENLLRALDAQLHRDEEEATAAS